MENEKIELLKKINELAGICCINGMIGNDYQSIFVGENVRNILIASTNEKHLMLLHKHMNQFLAEVQVLQKNKTLNEYLCFDVESCVN